MPLRYGDRDVDVRYATASSSRFASSRRPATTGFTSPAITTGLLGGALALSSRLREVAAFARRLADFVEGPPPLSVLPASSSTRMNLVG